MSGSQLDDLEEVFNKIDLLGDQMQKVAYAVFILAEKTINNFKRNHWTPPVVSFFLNISVKLQYMHKWKENSNLELDVHFQMTIFKFGIGFPFPNNTIS